MTTGKLALADAINLIEGLREKGQRRPGLGKEEKKVKFSGGENGSRGVKRETGRSAGGRGEERSEEKSEKGPKTEGSKKEKIFLGGGISRG